jgi:hypothetical protein
MAIKRAIGLAACRAWRIYIDTTITVRARGWWRVSCACAIDATKRTSRNKLCNSRLTTSSHRAAICSVITIYAKAITVRKTVTIDTAVIDRRLRCGTTTRVLEQLGATRATISYQEWRTALETGNGSLYSKVNSAIAIAARVGRGHVARAR